ncbi:uncharacterized protein LOC135849163 [Planococcus citri]|uniref:uncharacterized protein LOC135849163 n=1 Tax=Planococcus citri TaxID=170843 RepID=UPI0031F99484
MLTYFEFSVLLGVFATLCLGTSASTLTPIKHATLEGFEFCKPNNPQLLKSICLVAANRLEIVDYDPSTLENLECKIGDKGKVLLDPGDGSEWQLVQDALLECVFNLPANKFNKPHTDTVTFGRGLETSDVYRYRWNKTKGRYLVDGLYNDMLKTLIPSASVLTPIQHAKLEGYEFCKQNDPQLLKNICLDTAKRFEIEKYDPSTLENLACKIGDQGKVLLNPGDGSEWQLVQDALLECVFNMPADDHFKVPHTTTITFGRGLKKYDLYRYRWDVTRKRYLVDGLYHDKYDRLKKLIDEKSENPVLPNDDF